MRLFRWLFRSRSDSSDLPERLIDIPTFRDPSPELLRRLRVYDPRAEVVYAGQGRWLVGRVKTNSPRRATGRRMALAIKAGDGFPSDRWPELRQALLMAQGFGVVVDVTMQGEPDGRLVNEFALAMHVEQGGRYLSPDEQQRASNSRDHVREQQTRERDLGRWLYSRSPHGRGNAWVSYTTRRTA